MQLRWILRGTKKIKQGVGLEEVPTIADIPRRSTNYRMSAKVLGLTSLKYYHLWKIIIIMIWLFLMISRIFSCGRKVLQRKALISSTSYHLLSTRERKMFLKVSQIPSPLVLWNFFHESKSMNYGSMMYVYGWMMEEHQPIDIDHQPIRDDDYIEDSMTQHYMELDEDFGANQDFGITLPSSRVC